MRKMSIFLLAGLLLTSIVAYTLTRIPRTSRGASAPDPSIVLGPVVTGWSMDDLPVSASKTLSFAAHIVELNEQRTAVVYSMLEVNAGDLTAASAISTQDENGHISKVVKVIPLAKVDRLEFGVMIFGPRQPDAHELRLVLGKTNPVIVNIAKEPRDLQTSVSLSQMLYRENYFDQLGYRISFNAWSWFTEDRVAQMLSDTGQTEAQLRQSNTPQVSVVTASATATPVPIKTLAVELAAGEPVHTEATLRIEDTTTHRVSYLYMLFLMNGDVRATLVQ